MPVLCIPGNHDDPAAMRRELRVDPFTVGGFRDFGSWRIVLLDSASAGFRQRPPQRARRSRSSTRR